MLARSSHGMTETEEMAPYTPGFLSSSIVIFESITFGTVRK